MATAVRTEAAMDGSGSERFRVRVRTNLDEVVERVEGIGSAEPRVAVRVRHAATERVAKPVRPVVAIPEDRWTPPTVTARLRRMSAAFARLPMSADIWPSGHKCSMPTPILKRSDDYAPAPVRVREQQRASEVDMAIDTMKDCLRLFVGDHNRRAALWAVALGWSWRAAAQEMRNDKLCTPVSHTRMGQLMAEVTDVIAAHWNAKHRPLHRDDLDLANSFHRNRFGGVSNLSN